MVDLPTIPNTVPQVHAPTHGVTPGQISAPYDELAANLSKGGDILSKDFAEPLAKQAGLKAVTVDAEGNLNVDRAPIIGEAANFYERAIHVAAVAKGESFVKKDLIDLRQKYTDDPAAFRKAADEYGAAKVAQYTKVAGEEVGVSIGKIVGDTSTLLYRGLSNSKTRADLKAAGAEIVGAANGRADDIVTLAEAGASGSGEFKKRVADYHALLKEAADNPLIALSPEQADAHLRDTMAAANAGAVVGAVRSAYREGGRDAAQATLAAHLDGNPHDRERIGSQAANEIDALDAQRENGIIANRQSVFATQASRQQEAYARLGADALSPSWLDRYGPDLGDRAHEQLSRAVYAAGGASTAVAVRNDLTGLALTQDTDLLPAAADALISGQVTKGDFAGFSKLAGQVNADANSRPWANTIRQDVERRNPAALAEVSDFLAASGQGRAPLTRAQAQPHVDAIVDQYDIERRRRMVASLPMPAFMTATRDKVEPKDVDTAHARTIAAAMAGRLDLAGIAREATLLDQWRSVAGGE